MSYFRNLRRFLRLFNIVYNFSENIISGRETRLAYGSQVAQILWKLRSIKRLCEGLKKCFIMCAIAIRESVGAVRGKQINFIYTSKNKFLQ